MVLSYLCSFSKSGSHFIGDHGDELGGLSSTEGRFQGQAGGREKCQRAHGLTEGPGRGRESQWGAGKLGMGCI